MTQELLEKLYNNPDELEKMAQEQQAVNDALEYLHKCAEEGGIDISQLSPEQQLELYNALVSEIQGEGQAEVAQEQPVDPTAVAQPAMQPAVAAPEMGGMTAEQQQKVAETMYFSEMFGKNAAHTYWKELQTLSKEAAIDAGSIAAMGGLGLAAAGVPIGSYLMGKSRGHEMAANKEQLDKPSRLGAMLAPSIAVPYRYGKEHAYLDHQDKQAAEHCDDGKGEKHKGSPTFEAMAMAKAKKMKEEHSKTAAFEALLQHRAEELLASGQV